MHGLGVQVFAGYAAAQASGLSAPLRWLQRGARLQATRSGMLSSLFAEPATVHFCEARLAQFPREPSNTISSAAYVAVCLWLFLRRGAGSRLPLSTVAVAEFGIGAGSIALHGTGTFAGELLDLTGMFFLSACLVALALGRLLKLGDRAVALTWLLAVALPLLLLAVYPASGIASFAVCLVFGMGVELVLWRRRQSPEFRYFAQNLGLFGIALVFWVFDVSKLVCMESNHWVTGHAVWHVLNAFAIERLYTFYQVRLNRLDVENARLDVSKSN
jgi:hypothetical protein